MLTGTTFITRARSTVRHIRSSTSHRHLSPTTYTRTATTAATVYPESPPPISYVFTSRPRPPFTSAPPSPLRTPPAILKPFLVPGRIREPPTDYRAVFNNGALAIFVHSRSALYHLPKRSPGLVQHVKLLRQAEYPMREILHAAGGNRTAARGPLTVVIKSALHDVTWDPLRGRSVEHGWHVTVNVNGFRTLHIYVDPDRGRLTRETRVREITM